MEEKSREEVLAERKLRKAAKLAKKKGPPKTQNESQSTDNTELDCARVNFDKLKISGVTDATRGDIPPSDSKKSPVSLAATDVRPTNIQKADTVEEQTSVSLKAEKMTEENNTENNLDGGKSKAQLRAERRAKQVLFLPVVHPSPKGIAKGAEVSLIQIHNGLMFFVSCFS